MLRTIKFIVKDIQWSSLFDRRWCWWFISIHVPYILICLVGTIYKPSYKNLYWNTKVYDGISRNGFKNGNLIQFLSQLGAIKKPKSLEDDLDHRAYWIGSEDEDQD